ncbi:hypothetical protein DFQ29_001940 [Apophysomyces sp. BC1021]|nr:hypothetical protein DFQ29_001940 [Apophysomyces sp. BC1021]
MPSAKRSRPMLGSDGASEGRKKKHAPSRSEPLSGDTYNSITRPNLTLNETVDATEIDTEKSSISTGTPVNSALDKTKVARLLQEFEKREYKKREAREKGKALSKKELIEKARQQNEMAKKEDTHRIGLVESAAPQVCLVNGEITLDTGSLVVTQQSSLDTHQELDEENPNNAGSINLALAKHGLNFAAIADEIPDRNYRQVKQKYNREDRIVPWKITEYQSGR